MSIARAMDSMLLGVLDRVFLVVTRRELGMRRAWHQALEQQEELSKVTHRKLRRTAADDWEGPLLKDTLLGAWLVTAATLGALAALALAGPLSAAQASRGGVLLSIAIAGVVSVPLTMVVMHGVIDSFRRPARSGQDWVVGQGSTVWTFGGVLLVSWALVFMVIGGLGV